MNVSFTAKNFVIFVKNSRKGREVNNRVGERGVNLNLDNVFKYTVCFFEITPNFSIFELRTLVQHHRDDHIHSTETPQPNNILLITGTPLRK